MVRYSFVKMYIRGDLWGQSKCESMDFQSHEAAQTWLTYMNKADTLDFVIQHFIPEHPSTY